jgi:hypothetical protein
MIVLNRGGAVRPLLCSIQNIAPSECGGSLLHCGISVRRLGSFGSGAVILEVSILHREYYYGSYLREDFGAIRPTAWRTLVTRGLYIVEPPGQPSR